MAAERRQAPGGWDRGPTEELLRPWTDAEVLGRYEVGLVASVRRLSPEPVSDGALLALALTARAVRLGHVCLDLDAVRTQLAAALVDADGLDRLDLPDPSTWRDDLASSPIVALEGPASDPVAGTHLRPLVLDGGRLYLERYWRFEVDVTRELDDRCGRSGPADDGAVEAVLATVFGGVPRVDDGPPDLQFVAARRALTSPVSVIAGGPGTGKTHTVARVLAAAHLLAVERGEVFRAALAAPTGKAAARMAEAVEQQVRTLVAEARIGAAPAGTLAGITPTTIHSLLGFASRTSFRHDRDHPLLHDLVIVDETSMVSLPLLARLLDAVRPEARLVLVGDPFQLASIEAGTVMGDLVGGRLPGDGPGAGPLGGRVTELRRGHRFDAGSGTAALALAVRDGDAGAVIDRLSAGGAGVHWVRPDDPVALAAIRDQVVTAATDVVTAALAGDGAAALAAAGRIKVLAAVRRGPFCLAEWSDLIDTAVQAAIPLAGRSGWPRVGTPVMVTRNDRVNDLANGDVGVVIQSDDGRWVVLSGGDEPRRLAPARLGEWEPWWAMTIHKSQGSEFPHAVVSLPSVDSPILTRELLYTAVTRAKPEVTVVGSEDMIRRAVDRPVTRASGLRDRLWPGT
jgi:exodeoxyribonuclease V alpha subunit